MNVVFQLAAKERLVTLYPQDGEERYAKLEKFCSIAQKNPGTPLVVPAEIDGDLHEVLSARNEEGKGFELTPIAHGVKQSLNAIGKSLNELSDSVSVQTRNILQQEGFKIKDSKYQAHACTFTVVN
jgi:hypothetical protein